MMPAVFIEPYTDQLLGDRLFDTSESLLNRDGVLEVSSQRRSRAGCCSALAWPIRRS